MTLLHTKYMYTSFGSCGFIEEDFFMYFHYMADSEVPGVWPVWTPGGMVGRITKEENDTL